VTFYNFAFFSLPPPPSEDAVGRTPSVGDPNDALGFLSRLVSSGMTQFGTPQAEGLVVDFPSVSALFGSSTPFIQKEGPYLKQR